MVQLEDRISPFSQLLSKVIRIPFDGSRIKVYLEKDLQGFPSSISIDDYNGHDEREARKYVSWYLKALGLTEWLERPIIIQHPSYDLKT